MYMWFEEMGLIILPDIKDKADFAQRFELLMRRMVTQKLIDRLTITEMIDCEVKRNDP